MNKTGAGLMDCKTGCLICGEKLVYLKQPERAACYYCHQVCESDIKCEDDHFVCDTCHSLPANDLIEQFCLSSKLEDPVEAALILLRNPKVKMHGPEHHFLVPAVLLSAYYNAEKNFLAKEKQIKEARKRAEKVPGGFCGSHGNCGAGVGSGIFISLITGATPLSGRDWKLSNMMTARSLLSIAEHGGPRCCKRNIFLSLLEAMDFLKENFDLGLSAITNIKCEFSLLNRECLQERCLFYEQNI